MNAATKKNDVTPLKVHPRVVLEYLRGEGAADCPNLPTLENRVAVHLGFLPFHEDADRRMVVRIEVDNDDTSLQNSPKDAEEKRLRATVAIFVNGEQQGIRALFAPVGQCEELSSALQLAMVIAIDPASLTRPPPSPVPEQCKDLPPVIVEKIVEVEKVVEVEKIVEVEKVVEVEKIVEVEKVVEVETKASPFVLFPESTFAEEVWPKFFAYAGGQGVMGSTTELPQLGFHAGGGAKFHPAFSLAFESRFELGGEQPREDDPAAGNMNVQLASLLVLPCTHSGWLTGCLSGSIGVVGMTYLPPTGFESNEDFIPRPTSSIGGRGGIEIPIWKLFLRLFIDVQVNWLRAAAFDNYYSRMYIQPLLQGSAGISIGGVWP